MKFKNEGLLKAALLHSFTFGQLLFSHYIFIFSFKQITVAVRNLANVGNTPTFSTMDSFRVIGPHGAPKVGFGYGFMHNNKVYIYVQEDPCPC